MKRKGFDLSFAFVLHSYFCVDGKNRIVQIPKEKLDPFWPVLDGANNLFR